MASPSGSDRPDIILILPTVSDTDARPRKAKYDVGNRSGWVSCVETNR